MWHRFGHSGSFFHHWGLWRSDRFLENLRNLDPTLVKSSYVWAFGDTYPCLLDKVKLHLSHLNPSMIWREAAKFAGAYSAPSPSLMAAGCSESTTSSGAVPSGAHHGSDDPAWSNWYSASWCLTVLWQGVPCECLGSTELEVFSSDLFQQVLEESNALEGDYWNDTEQARVIPSMDRELTKIQSLYTGRKQ